MSQYHHDVDKQEFAEMKIGLNQAVCGETTAVHAVTDGSEETLWDYEELRDYDLGEGD